MIFKKVWNYYGKKSMIYLLSVAMLFAMTGEGFAATGSELTGHWAGETIQKWMERGWALGNKNGAFEPDRRVTRAEFFTFVNRAMGYSDKSERTFSDVKEDDWFAESISIAAAAGYIQGYEDGSIRPRQPITRQEAAVIMAKIGKLTPNPALADRYKDRIPEWSKGSVGAVLEKEWMIGFPDGTFKPGNPITRAEAVTALERLAGAKESLNSVVYDRAGTYGPASGQVIEEGDVVITADGVILQNTVIEGDLTIAESVGEGEVTLRGVTVKGKTMVNGGGENSVYLEDSIIVNIILDKSSGTVRIVAQGETSVARVDLRTSGVLQETDLHGEGFVDLVLEKAESEDTYQVDLDGEFGKISLRSSSIELNVMEGTIEELAVDSSAENSTIKLGPEVNVVKAVVFAVVSFLGEGSIDSAEIFVSGVSFVNRPNSITGPGANEIVLSGGNHSSSSSTNDNDSDPALSTLKVLSAETDMRGKQVTVVFDQSIELEGDPSGQFSLVASGEGENRIIGFTDITMDEENPDTIRLTLEEHRLTGDDVLHLQYEQGESQQGEIRERKVRYSPQ